MNRTEEQKRLERFVKSQQPTLLRNLPGEKKLQLFELLKAVAPEASGGEIVLTQQVTHTSSPVPPAELLMGYNSAFEGGAERLFSMVEKQANHRQSIETKVVDGQAGRSQIGQIFAFVLALAFGGIGLYLGIIGERWLAGGIFTTTIGGLVATFIYGQHQQTRNLDKKAPKK